MRRMKRLKSRRNASSQLSLNLLDTSRPTVTPYGTVNAEYTKKEPQDLNTSAQETSKEKKRYQHLCLMERSEIQKLLKEGFGISAIARQLGRGKQTIAVEVRRNGGRDKYNAETAQKLSMERKIERDIKCGNSIKKNLMTPLNLQEKIQQLEMQMDILVEVVKALRNGSR